jgi:hypothetical protein
MFVITLPWPGRKNREIYPFEELAWEYPIDRHATRLGDNVNVKSLQLERIKGILFSLFELSLLAYLWGFENRSSRSHLEPIMWIYLATQCRYTLPKPLCRRSNVREKQPLGSSTTWHLGSAQDFARSSYTFAVRSMLGESSQRPSKMNF